jgi:hypothetical protein
MSFLAALAAPFLGAVGERGNAWRHELFAFPIVFILSCALFMGGAFWE